MFAWEICIINVTDRYGVYISLLEMSMIIQKLFLQVIFVLLLVFLHRPSYGASLSLRAYRRRTQDSEVKVVSLLKCRSLSKLLLKFIFVVSFVFEIGQIMGLPLSLRTSNDRIYLRKIQDSSAIIINSKDDLKKLRPNE